jgi:hypothetical protein
MRKNPMSEFSGIAPAVVIALHLGLSGAALAVAQDRPPQAEITISMLATYRNGTTRTKATTGDDIRIRAGESRNSYFYISANGAAGALDYQGPVRGGSRYKHAWTVKPRLVSTGIDAVTFELDWQRFGLVDGKMSVTASDHRAITLGQGDRHVVDFVTCSPADSNVANVLIEVQAAPIEDPEYAAIQFGYDLWLTQQAADGAKTVRRIALNGRQGDKLPFKFGPVPLPLDRSARADADSPLKMYVDGTIVGRATRGGTIQVALQTRRHMGGFGSFGTKIFDVAPDEAVTVELPAEGGYWNWKSPVGDFIASPRPGVTVTGDGRVRVELGQYLEGAKTAIALRIHRDR